MPIILVILIVLIVPIIPYRDHSRGGIRSDGLFGRMGPMTMAKWEPDELEVPRLFLAQCRARGSHSFYNELPGVSSNWGLQKIVPEEPQPQCVSIVFLFFGMTSCFHTFPEVVSITNSGFVG